MATPVCSICTHPKHAAIDEALSTGGALIPTSARFGVSKSALHRHKVGCLAPKIAAVAKVVQSGKETKASVTRAKAIVAGEVPTIDDVLSLSALCERLGRSLDRLETGAVQAAGNEQHASHAALAGQLHRGIESVGKLKGYYSDAAQAPQQARFSVVINLPEPGAPASHVIDCTPERGNEPSDTVPQVTARRATANSFGFGDDED